MRLTCLSVLLECPQSVHGTSLVDLLHSGYSYPFEGVAAADAANRGPRRLGGAASAFSSALRPPHASPRSERENAKVELARVECARFDRTGRARWVAGGRRALGNKEGSRLHLRHEPIAGAPSRWEWGDPGTMILYIYIVLLGILI